MKINSLRHQENNFFAPTCLSRAVIFELLIGSVQTITMGSVSGLIRTNGYSQISHMVFQGFIQLFRK